MKQPMQKKLAGTVDAFRYCYYKDGVTVALTTSYTKDTSTSAVWSRDPIVASTGWVDTAILPVSGGLGAAPIGIYDLVQLVAYPAIGSAGKIRFRIALSNDNGTTTDYYREGGIIREWDFDYMDDGTRITLDPISLNYRYFAIEAKAVDGSASSTGLVMRFIFLHANQGDGKYFLAKGDIKPTTQSIKAYGALGASGAWSTPVEIDTKNARWLEVIGYYVEGASSTGGRGEIEVQFLRLWGSRYYGAPSTAVDRGVVKSDGTQVIDKMRQEIQQVGGQNLQYNLTGGSWTGGTATITIGAHAIRVGDLVTVRSVTPSGYDADLVEVTAVGATTISYAVASNPGAWSSGGTVWLAEPFLLVFDNALRYDMIRVLARESSDGDTTNPGDIILIGTILRD